MDGRTLRDYRKRYGLTQAEVARNVGMRQPDLSAIEHDRRGSSAGCSRVRDAIRRLARPSLALADPEVRRALHEILARAGATEVRVFGSSARGDDQPGSDLDLMAKFPPGFDLFDAMDLEAELETLLGICVDVVSDDERTPYALATAKEQAIPL